MCTTCGCSDGAAATVTDIETGSKVAVRGPGSRGHPHEGHDHRHDHGHSHGNDHHHDHDHGDRHKHSTIIELQQAVLAKNDKLAARNRGWFEGRETLALNLVSSPGAGKTSLLVRTLRDLSDQVTFSVIEGDQETQYDAERIRATGCRVVQINTGTGCHLEADMLARGLERLQPPPRSVVMIENVGNLVCPALFDLGENCKVVVLSVTEGEDKPLKYPHMFRAAELVILNKIDLLPHLDFDVERCSENARQVNPNASVLQLSATTGAGLDRWYQWVLQRLPFRTQTP